MLSKRTKTIKNKMLEPKRVVDIERAILYTQSHKETEGEPMVIRRAKALRHILQNHEIVLDNDDLLVGNRTRKPRAGVISPEMSPYWILEEINDFETRPQDKFVFSEQDKRIYKEELYPYWAGRSLNDYYQKHVNPVVVEATKSKIFSINQTDKGQGHIIPNYEILLDKGFGGLLKEVEESPQSDFKEASIIVLEASIQYIKRYRLLVQYELKKATGQRVDELIRIIEVLTHIEQGKPRDLYEALQLLWIFCVILQHESNASSISLGRLDQYLYNFYKKETDTKFVKELFDCFYLKTNTIVFIRSKESAKFFAGFPSGYTLVVGGVDKDGKDNSNELSKLLLELHKDIALPQPNLSVRMHAEIDNDLLQTAAKTIRLGHGLPQIFGDSVNIDSFVNRDISLEDARDYAVVGCVELSIPGKMYGLHDIAMFNLLKCMEVTMHNHPKGFESYETFKQAIKDTISEYVGHMVDGSNTCDIAHKVMAPVPFLSTFMDGCIEQGLDITEGGTTYNFSGVQGIGLPNLNDSLYVMKKAIWDDEIITYSKLLEVLNNNYEGEEVLRQTFINKYIKYGNDNDEVDTIGKELMSYYNEEVSKHKNPRGGYFQPGSYTVSAHIPLGEKVGATADGRKAGDQLADGGLSPMVGRDRLGPTASLKSVSKLDNVLTSNGSLLNVKFSPSTLEGQKGIEHLMAYIRAFDQLKIQHIQFNVQSRETLIDAQLHPENHKDLVIRVAGYSAMFIELSKAIQDDIINRSEHTL